MASSTESDLISRPLSSAVPSPTPFLSSLYKAHSNNFLIWRQQILATVAGYGLEGYLSGNQDIPPPLIEGTDSSPPQANPAFLAWYRQDQLLSAWIQGSLSESTMILIVGLKSSKDIWEAIESSFASQSKAKVMHYKLQLQTFKRNNLSMQEYLNKIKSFCDLLSSAGCIVSEEDHILHILTGLGSEYDPVMVTVTSRGSWTVPDVSALLLSFESRLEAARSSSINTDGSPSAHVAYTSPRNDNRPPMPRNNGRFSNFRGGRGRGRFNNGRLTCQLCHKPGHSADRCWNRFDQGFSPQANSRPLLPTPNFQQSAPSANLVHSRPHHGYQIPPRSQPASSHPPSEFNLDASSITSWYPDSGATNHVSNDFTTLNTATEYQGGNSLLLGNGVGINIAHIGSSHFKSSPHPASKSLFLHNLLHVPHISKNLLSVSQFALDNDVYFEFHSNFCLVKDRATKQVILKGTLENGLYHFHLHKVKSSMSSCSLQHKSSSCVSDSSPSSSSPAIFSTSVISSLDVWHKRLGHSAFDMVEHALKSCNISYKSIKSSVLCHPCCIAKSHRLPYPLLTPHILPLFS